MKRKHDALVDDQGRVDSAPAQSSLAQSKTGQYLQGQDLLTESVSWSLQPFAASATPSHTNAEICV